MHTIAWEKICQPRNGSLGLPRLGVLNQTMMAKLLWRMINVPEELSSFILSNKYVGWQALVRGTKALGASHI